MKHPVSPTYEETGLMNSGVRDRSEGWVEVVNHWEQVF